MKQTNELLRDEIGKLQEEIDFIKSLQSSIITGRLNYDIVEYLPLTAYNAYNVRDYLSSKQLNSLVTDRLIQKYCYFCGLKDYKKEELEHKRFYIFPLRERKNLNEDCEGKSDIELYDYYFVVIDISI